MESGRREAQIAFPPFQDLDQPLLPRDGGAIAAHDALAVAVHRDQPLACLRQISLGGGGDESERPIAVDLHVDAREVRKAYEVVVRGFAGAAFERDAAKHLLEALSDSIAILGGDGSAQP